MAPTVRNTCRDICAGTTPVKEARAGLRPSIENKIATPARIGKDSDSKTNAEHALLHAIRGIHWWKRFDRRTILSFVTLHPAQTH
eukprot:5631689-Amphidinium_carterae.1